MTPLHSLLLVFAASVTLFEFSLAAYHWEAVFSWLSHNLWVVIIPFTKSIVKKLIALNLFAFFKAAWLLIWHLSKLLLLKLLKTLGVRYGVFFTQQRWYWIRRTKVLFLRRGKQFFRSAKRFWQAYQPYERWIVLIAFFPVVVLMFFLGLSFNVTRKTMVQKAQETAILEAATTASKQNRGIRSYVKRLDKWTLQQLKSLRPQNNQ